jgi:hypothetical protein
MSFNGVKPWNNKLYRHHSKLWLSKKLTCKGTLRQGFIKAYRLEIQPIRVGIFDQALDDDILLWCLYS